MAKINSPNFMCIGAAKCATTTLYNILKQHPQIGLSSFKEPHFFDNFNNFKNGKEWYLNNYYKSLFLYRFRRIYPNIFGIKKCPSKNIKFFW